MLSPSPVSRLRTRVGLSLTPRLLFLETAAGLIAATVAIAYAVGFSALIFDGPIAAGLPNGVWAILVGTAVSSAIVGVMTSIPPMAANVEATTISMLKVISVAVVAASVSAGEDTQQAIVNVVAAIVVATFISGVLFSVIGGSGFGRYLRFVPSAVTGGFLGATGLVVLLASLKLATGHGVATVWQALASDPGAQGKAICAVLFFVAYQVLRRVVVSPLLLPLGFIGLCALVFVLSHAGSPFADVVADWFPSGAREIRPWWPMSAAAVGAVDWRTVFAAAPEMAAMAVVIVVTLVVRTSGFEVSLNRRADYDREFAAHGIASIATSLFGGAACAAAPGTTRLMADLGSTTPVSALVVTGIVLLILLAGIDLTTYFALPLLGGLLMVVGWTLTVQAIAPPLKQRAWSDLVVVCAIVVVAMTVGFAAATAIGFAFSCIMFALNYGRIGVVRRHLTRTSFSSHVSRNAEAERALRERGDKIHIYWLGGYIFFGSSDRLYEQIREQIERQRQEPVAFVVIDGAGVTGLDTAAVQSLAKLRAFCAERHIAIVYASLSPHIRDVIRGAGLIGDKAAHIFPALNPALAWCEDRLLPAAAGPGDTADFAPWLAAEIGRPAASEALMAFLQRRTLELGEALYVAGSGADTIDIIATGSVSIVVGSPHKPVEVRRMARRTVLGEMGFFRGQKRSASVIADGDVVVYTLSRGEYQRMLREMPDLAQQFLVYLIKILSDRLEFANGAVASLLHDPAEPAGETAELTES
ncbi:MAG: cyclic nucleotide-binding domain-containing protein [Hyphomicrobiales bacterium]|nr:MAG: cyclic nucleotide-binding domain-containing protein [Hyphomicrobiales bacterium]